ncbi:MAG: phosphotransferase [Myxococcales bacterium]|nr:phosphotransferase [Myxococcales bacterium]
MRIADMQAREDFDAVLYSTLEAGWSAMLGYPIRVEALRGPTAQTWYVSQTLGGFFVGRPGKRVREYLRDGLRYTPRKARFVPQWLISTGLSTSLGLEIASTKAFSVSPEITRAGSMLVVPGNQRIRVFDFRKNVVRVILKTGFSPDAMAREISFRKQYGSEPFVLEILKMADDLTWFEEPIVHSYALPRCPPWYRRSSLAATALGDLEQWSSAFTHSVPSREYSDTLLERLFDLLELLKERFTSCDLRPAQGFGKALAAVASEMGELELAPSHGDFQGGNVLVTKASRRPIIIDWEHSGERWRYYDRLVMGLSTRSPARLSTRWKAFIAGDTKESALSALPKSPSWRTSACALVALEDLLWYASESLAGPYSRPSEGLTLLLSELEQAPFCR